MKKNFIEKLENEKLIDRYPFLQPRSIRTGEIPEDFNYDYCCLKDEIPDGWWKKFGVLWCEDFLNVCKESNIDASKIYIVQAKEKFGQLRVYLNGYPNKWHDHEYAWDYISEHTCIKCGKFPVKMRNDGWISPWCDDCFKEQHQKLSDAQLKMCDYVDIFKGRLVEYIKYQITEKNKYGDYETRNVYVDMKPYYRLLNYDMKDIVSKEEMDKVFSERNDEEE